MTSDFLHEARMILLAQNPDHNTIRIRTTTPGCLYTLDTSATQADDDLGISTDGISIVVSPKEAKRITGGTLGVVQTLREHRLSFKAAGGPRSTNPGRLQLSRSRLKLVQPELAGPKGIRRRFRDWQTAQARYRGSFDYVANHIQTGDSRAAIVLYVGKFVTVAAYTDELDCVALLEFPASIGRQYRLSEGTELITVNTYSKQKKGTDLMPGPRSHGVWSNFHPIIGDFVSADENRLRELKRTISRDEWDRTWNMGVEYFELCIEDSSRVIRDGAPLDSGEPAIADL